MTKPIPAQVQEAIKVKGLLDNSLPSAANESAIDLGDPLLPARVIVERFGISDMSLWRWLQSPDLQFPRPIVIQRRRYFRASEIAAFEARQASASAQ